MKFRALGLAGIAFTMSAIPALAHHSFAMFDADSKMTLEGIVKEFQWTNPHAWVILTVDRKGRAEQWGQAAPKSMLWSVTGPWKHRKKRGFRTNSDAETDWYVSPALWSKG